MNAVIIFIIILSLWIVSGFLRPLKPQLGLWHLVGIGNKALFAIDGDSAFPIIPLPWPLKVINIPLTWSEYVKDGRDYGNTKLKFDRIDKEIGRRTENVPYIRKLEFHPFVVEVFVEKGGAKVAIIFNTTLHVFDPLKAVRLKNFLAYGEGEFSDVVTPWAFEVPFDNVLGMRVDELKEIKVKHLREGVEKEYDLTFYLNQEKFRKFGFEIAELSAQIGVHKDSQALIDKRLETAEEIRETERLEQTEKRQVKQRVIWKNDATAKGEAIKSQLAPIKDYQMAILGGQEKIAKAHASGSLHTLVNPGGEQSAAAQDMVSDITATMIGTAKFTSTPTVSPAIKKIEEKK